MKEEEARQNQLAHVPGRKDHKLKRSGSDENVGHDRARHHETGEPIPEPLMRARSGARRMFSGVETQSQVSYALFDQWVHGGQPRRDPLESLALDALAPAASPRARSSASGRLPPTPTRTASARSAAHGACRNSSRRCMYSQT